MPIEMFTSLIFYIWLTNLHIQEFYLQTFFSFLSFLFRVDVTEIQVALMIVFVLSTFGGATMWDYTVK